MTFASRIVRWIRRGRVLIAAVVLAGCAESGTEFPVIEAGVVTLQLPSSAAPDTGLAVRIAYPGTEQRRYPEGAPVVVFVPGGHAPGNLGGADVPADVTANGYVWITLLLPGGSALDAASGGAYDYRGPLCQRALADVLRYALGLETEVDGKSLADRVPFALPDDVGVIGSSNGGNLALTTFARYGGELDGLAWFVAWESPIGDQTVTCELSTFDGTLNPYYQPAAGVVTTLAWPGLAEALAFDPAVQVQLEDPAGGAPLTLQGKLFLDDDGDATLDPGEFPFSPLGGPGVEIAGQHRPKAYTSVELAQAVESQAARLFPAGAPPWWASRAEVEAYWAERDGSLAFAAAQTALPNLLVMSLGSVQDHVQRQPDHPHVRAHQQGWLDAGQAFARLNPDAAYLARVTGLPVDGFPENPAGQSVPFPETEAVLMPETLSGQPLDGALTQAAVLELADRAHFGERTPDLDAVLGE